jgi:HD-GYP domain-containing protein (c-di-GMP phosphodiesterase class II)
MVRPYVPQPLLGLALATLGLSGLATAWAGALAMPLASLNPATICLAAVLTAGALAAQVYPVHVARAFKLSIVTIPLFLLASLTPPALAATCAGLAVLIGEMAQRRIKGSLPSDMALASGRFSIIVLLSGLVAHLTPPPVPAVAVGGLTLPLDAPLDRLPLLLAAAVLYLGDVLTGSLEISAITTEAPHRVARTIVREASAGEAVQYLVALLGALAARDDAWAVVLLVVPAIVIRHLLKLGLEVHDETRALLESMADAVDLRDPYTGGHSRRVTAYAAAILNAMDLHGPEAELITAAARVHDIGKIAIPDRILNKPERLTESERLEMESHPQRGADFLARYPDFRRGIAIVLHHHERIDGKGYPHGLVGDAIPFGARVIAVADTFDAMTSDRPYRKGMTVARAAAILAEGRGSQWDGAVVDVFINQVLPTLAEQPDRAAMPDESGKPAVIAVA